MAGPSWLDVPVGDVACGGCLPRCDRVQRVIPPEAWATTASARSPVLILCHGSLRIGKTGKPPGLHTLHVGCNYLGFLRLGDRIRLGLLLRQLTRMHDYKAERLGGNSPFAVLHRHRPENALPMPAAGLRVFGPPWFLHQERQPGVLLSPGFQLLAHGTSARD